MFRDKCLTKQREPLYALRHYILTKQKELGTPGVDFIVHNGGVRLLQCVAVCCSVLQSVAVCWSTLKCEVRCIVHRAGVRLLQCVAVYLLQCVAVCCSVLQCAAKCCSVLRSSVENGYTADFWDDFEALKQCSWIAATVSVNHCNKVCSSRKYESVGQIGRHRGAAVCCSVLQCVAVCCSVLQCVAIVSRKWLYSWVLRRLGGAETVCVNRWNSEC